MLAIPAATVVAAVAAVGGGVGAFAPFHATGSNRRRPNPLRGEPLRRGCCHCNGCADQCGVLGVERCGLGDPSSRRGIGLIAFGLQFGEWCRGKLPRARSVQGLRYRRLFAAVLVACMVPSCCGAGAGGGVQIAQVWT